MVNVRFMTIYSILCLFRLFCLYTTWLSFTSFCLSVYPIDMHPMGERRKRHKIWIENSFLFSRLLWQLTHPILKRLYPPRGTLVDSAAGQLRKSTGNQHPVLERFTQFILKDTQSYNKRSTRGKAAAADASKLPSTKLHKDKKSHNKQS